MCTLYRLSLVVQVKHQNQVDNVKSSKNDLSSCNVDAIVGSPVKQRVAVQMSGRIHDRTS